MSVLSSALLLAALASSSDEPPHLAQALEVARWLDSVAVDGDEGRRWPVDVDAKDASFNDALYNGASGVVLFHQALWEITDDVRWRDEALRGAHGLVQRLPAAASGCGLYTGLAGIGFVLGEVHRTTGDERCELGARRCLDLILAATREEGDGVTWDGVTDIISGASGIGLALLHASASLDHAPARDTAIAAGRRLLEVGRDAETGRQWFMSPSYPRTMPNFSHGTAGVCAFLLELYATTRDERFLDGARDGLAFLDAIAHTDDGGWQVHHHAPGGEDLFYLGWCHGPPGTARTHHRMWQLTGNAQARQRVHDALRTLQLSGIPAGRTPGFWNNVGICCGSAGIAEFALECARSFHDEDALAFADRLHADLMDRATRDADGLRWTHAEHRVRPELLTTQTGFMQGAAGIGLWCLERHAHAMGLGRLVQLPDVPWSTPPPR